MNSPFRIIFTSMYVYLNIPDKAEMSIQINIYD